MLCRPAVSLVLALFCLSTGAFARDRDSDFGIPDGPSESPPQVVEARANIDRAYQEGNYAKVVELSTWLIDNYPGDNVHVAYHLRASAKIEQGRNARSAKLVREGITDARQGLQLAGAEYPWLHIPYLYGLTNLAELERRPEHADMAIRVVSPVLQHPASKNFTDEDRANLYYQRGLAYAVKGDYKLAASDHAEAIRISSNQLGSHLKRAEALAALGQTKETLAAYDEAVARFPNNLVVYNDRGKFRRSSGDLDGAISDFARCLQIDPKFAVGYVNRGVSLADQNSPQAAEGDYTEALKLKPDPVTTGIAYRLRGAARLAQGNAQEAVRDFDAALKLNPQDATLYEERGFAAFFQKNFSAAVSDFAKALQMNPKLVHLLPWQALALSRAGMTAEARALLGSAANGKTPPEGWILKLCSFLLEQATEQDLKETAAASTTPREVSRHTCEANFFAGQKLLLGAEPAKAAERFRDVLASKEFPMSAYRGACYELGEFAK